MRRNHLIAVTFALGLSFPSFAMAQHRGAVHGGGGGGTGGGGMHPGMMPHGGMHGGMMSPEEYMMRQFMLMGGGMSNRGHAGSRTNSPHSSNAGSAGKTPANTGNLPSGRAGHGNTAHPNASGQAKSSSGQAKTAGGQAKTASGQAKTQKNGQKNHQTKSDSQEHKKEHEVRNKAREVEHSKRSTRPSTKNSTRAADSNAIRLLRNAHGKLHEADADYQGHRMRAMEHIASAVSRLESGAGLNGGGLVSMGGFGGGSLSQSQSDEKLREARLHLQQTQGMLGTGTSAAEHHRNAHAAISEAIREVDTALRIK
jgi:hypothetical protein